MILALGVMLGAAAAAGTIFYRLGIAQQSLSDRDGEAALWAAFQLDREARLMDDILRIWRNGDVGFDEVRRRMDVLVSRINYYHESDLGGVAGSPAREAALLAEIETRIRALDARLPDLPHAPDTVAAVFEARHITHEIEQATSQLVYVTNQQGADDRARGKNESRVLYHALGVATGMLVATVTIALAAALVQNRALVRAQQRAEAIGAQLRDAAMAAEVATRSKATFLATMSHEIRTPMNGVLGAASLLAAGPLSAAQRRHVEMIAACGQALLSLIDDILDFSKLEAGQTDFAVTAFSPQALIETVADIIAPMLRARSLLMVATPTPRLPRTLHSDPHRLRQVLVNLLSNAVKFTQTGGVALVLDLATDAQGRSTLVATVSDSGIGIAPSVIGGLFREFEQGDPAIGRRYGGTGLGLAICRRIVESLGGQIGVDSALGAGSRFWVEIPMHGDSTPPTPPTRGTAAVQTDIAVLGAGLAALLQVAGYRVGTPDEPVDLLISTGDAPAAIPLSGPRRLHFGPDGTLPSPLTLAGLLPQVGQAIAPAAPATPLPTLPRMRILVAEDSAMNREVMEQVLQTMGHRVTLADNGRDAVDRLSAGETFDAVLLDLQMPVMDGLAAARAIRRLPPPGAATPILAVTANAMAADREACLAAGMSGFLAKPITIARLHAALSALLEGRPPPLDAPPHAQPPTPADAAVIDTDHRAALHASLRDGALARLAVSFWQDLAEDLAPLFAPDGDTKTRGERLHRLSGAAATLGYARVAAAARAQRHRDAPDIAPLLASLREALAADAALLPVAVADAARAALG